MKTLSLICCLLLGIMVLLAPYSGCTPTDGDNGNVDNGDGGDVDNGDDDNGDNNGDDNDDDNGDDDDDDDATDEALIKTEIVFLASGYLDTSGNLAVGNDLIVWGLHDEGVFYLVPSTADEDTTAGIMVPNSDLLFGTHDFTVAGKKIVLVRGTNEVTVFDTQTGGTPEDIPGNDITLHALPTEANAPGHMVADGLLVATINDPTEVADGNQIKVIDLSGATPTVISCAMPTDFVGYFEQVAIDADRREVAAVSDTIVYVWDIDDETAEPMQYPLGGGGIRDVVQIQMDGGYVLYRQGFEDASALLDMSDGTVIPFNKESEFAANSPVAINGGSFGFFVAEEDADLISGASVVYRSAIGETNDAPGATLASQVDEVVPANDECGGERGRYGYGGQMAITPDGARWFMSGTGPLDNNYLEYLQMREDGDWELFADEETLSGWVMASDVVCSGDTVAFRALRQVPDSGCLTDDEWVLGFIVLDRLD